MAWSVPVSPDVLVSDPYSSAAAVFVPSSGRLGSSDRESLLLDLALIYSYVRLSHVHCS